MRASSRMRLQKALRARDLTIQPALLPRVIFRGIGNSLRRCATANAMCRGWGQLAWHTLRAQPRLFWIWTVGAITLTAGFAASAFFGSEDEPVINALTEGSGIALVTYLTVGFIEWFRRHRERIEADARLRRSLVSELSRNLSRLVTRYEDSALQRHVGIGRVRESLNIGQPQDPMRKIPLSRDDRDDIIMGTALASVGARLATTAMEEAVGSGAFVEVGIDGEVRTTEVHTSLETLLEDIERLRTRSSSSVGGPWDEGLVKELSVAERVGGYEASWYYLLQMFGYYDRIEDVFSGHVLVLRLLLNAERPDRPRTRRPTTPLGPEMEEAIRSDTVTPDEVVRLVRDGIEPFGGTMARQSLESVRELLIDRSAQATREKLIELGVPEQKASIESLKPSFEKMFDELISSAAEGIKVLPHPKGQKEDTGQ